MGKSLKSGPKSNQLVEPLHYRSGSRPLPPKPRLRPRKRRLQRGTAKVVIAPIPGVIDLHQSQTRRFRQPRAGTARAGSHENEKLDPRHPSR